MTDRITLIRPDDWHIHLRDGEMLNHTVADAARTFSRAIIMPNLPRSSAIMLTGPISFRSV